MELCMKLKTITKKIFYTCLSRSISVHGYNIIYIGDRSTNGHK